VAISLVCSAFRDRDARGRQRRRRMAPGVAEASHRRSARRRRDHRTPTPPGRGRPQRAPSSESAVGRLPLHLGLPQEHRAPTPASSDVTVPVGTKSLPPSSLQSTGGMSTRVRSCRSARGAADRQTSARMRSTAASDVAIYDPSRRNLRLLASQNLRVVADGLSPSKAQS
jgi:hypothetical protein